MYLPAMGMFIDNHDLTRFSSLNDSAAALRNALTFTYFMEGLPIVFYGTEAQAKGTTADNSNRTPMWTYGFDMASPFFTWIRMLNWCATCVRIIRHQPCVLKGTAIISPCGMTTLRHTASCTWTTACMCGSAGRRPYLWSKAGWVNCPASRSTRLPSSPAPKRAS